MSNQLGLFGDDETQREFKLDRVGNPEAVNGYSLFFAIFPAESEAKRISHVVERIRADHGLKGKPFLPDRLHISLQAITKFEVPILQATVDAACAAAARVVCPPLPITFDGAALFGHEKAACVFRCDKDSGERIAPLRKQLGAGLSDVGLRHEASSTPHMTMLYDDPQRVFDESIAPINWTATRFVLILSHLGASHHQWVEQWPLTGRSKN